MSPTGDKTTQGQHVMTKRKLEALTKYWQKQLRIQDWIITPVFAKKEDMHSDTSVGQVTTHFAEKTAEIKILSDKYRAVPDKGDLEIEETIVHELLHIVLLGYDMTSVNSKVYKLCIEQPINQIAKALINAKYKTKEIK